MAENDSQVMQKPLSDEAWEKDIQKFLSRIPEEERKHQLLQIEQLRLQRNVKAGKIPVWTYGYVLNIAVSDKSKPVFKSAKKANKILAGVLQHYSNGLVVVRRGARQFQIVHADSLRGCADKPTKAANGFSYFTTRKLCKAYVSNEKAHNPDMLYNIFVANPADIVEEPTINLKPHNYRVKKNKVAI